MWFCIQCKLRVKKGIITESKIEESCRAIMKEYEERIVNLEQLINTKCDAKMVRQIVNEKDQTWSGVVQKNSNPQDPTNVKTVKNEINDSKTRENNLVI